mmetsp:Transcript_88577/g.236756  ORF Transcript_88577/g.236756 Transcript_88577/m.236756 type:complete len:264 (-) Transcript_88577:356-1147(-)
MIRPLLWPVLKPRVPGARGARSVGRPCHGRTGVPRPNTVIAGGDACRGCRMSRRSRHQGPGPKLSDALTNPGLSTHGQRCRHWRRTRPGRGAGLLGLRLGNAERGSQAERLLGRWRRGPCRRRGSVLRIRGLGHHRPRLLEVAGISGGCLGRLRHLRDSAVRDQQVGDRLFRLRRIRHTAGLQHHFLEPWPLQFCRPHSSSVDRTSSGGRCTELRETAGTRRGAMRRNVGPTNWLVGDGVCVLRKHLLQGVEVRVRRQAIASV